MSRVVTVLLRALLVVLFGGVVLAQVLTPVQATWVGEDFPEVAHLVVPYSAAAILALVCVQVALVAVWRLLSMVTGDQIFSVRALTWVDVILGATAVATSLATAVTIHLLAVVRTGGPGELLGLLGTVAAGSAMVLTMVVMRGLLTSAISFRGELAEVI